MKIFLVLFLLSFVVAGIALFVLSMMSKAGNAPGLVNNKFIQCPDRKNCVSSEDKKNSSHYVEPIKCKTPKVADDLKVLKKVIQNAGGLLQTEKDGYAAFTFTSKVFGFIDDLEIRHDEMNKIIHIRSASRVGYSDRGVNSKRVEIIRKLFNENSQ